MIDWIQVCLNLKAAGVSSKFIYRQTGISDKTVSAWRTGKVGEPRFSRGLALLKLHQRFCPQQHAREIYEKA